MQNTTLRSAQATPLVVGTPSRIIPATVLPRDILTSSHHIPIATIVQEDRAIPPTEVCCCERQCFIEKIIICALTFAVAAGVVVYLLLSD